MLNDKQTSTPDETTPITIDMIDAVEDEPRDAESGKVGWALAWLLGVPLPLLLVIYLITRAC
jgi:hypothetical protein